MREINEYYPKPSSGSDDFRKHEYKTIMCLFISKLIDDTIIDLGGAAFMQPGLVAFCRNFESILINLEISDENRVYNLTKDVILLGDEQLFKII